MEYNKIIRSVLLFCIIIITSSLLVNAQKNYLHENKSDLAHRMQWWKDATFGMFIHWGLYAVPAGRYGGQISNKTYAEWLMYDKNTPIPEYEKFAMQFNPEKFDAEKIVDVAKKAGMKYIVFTTKHHDGFSIWDTKVSNYNIVKSTPFKRDVLKELSDACRKAGIHFCTYYSIMDWHERDANDNVDIADWQNHAKKYMDWEHNAARYTPDTAAWSRYRENYLKPQLKELVTNYHPEVIWFDGDWILQWTEHQGEVLYNWLRNLNPNLIINNRVGNSRLWPMLKIHKGEEGVGDFGTPEQEILAEGSDKYWESCMTINDTWGYNSDDHNWKSTSTLLHNLVDIVSKGGNYLLNVGPTAEGLIPQESISRLDSIGKWMDKNGKAIYGNKRGLSKEQFSGQSTISQDNKTIYLFVDKVSALPLKLNNFSRKISSVNQLSNNKGIKFQKTDEGYTIKFPNTENKEIISVLQIVIE